MISVVIPALNEQEAIAVTLRDIRDTLTAWGGEFEILVVDDGSTDDTGSLAATSGARVLRHPHNLGYGRAVKTGIQAARYEYIVMTDADGSYPASDIPRLIQEMHKGYDMVVGARTGGAYWQSWWKTALRWTLRTIVEFSSERKIPDINSGFRLFRRSVAERYFDQLCDTFSFTTSLTLAFTMTRKFVAYIPIPYSKRIGKTKIRLFRDTVRTYLSIVQAILYYNPLRIFVVCSTITLCLSLLAFVLGVVFQVLSGFYLGAGGLLTTLIIFSMGLLADLLKQIMDRR